MFQIDTQRRPLMIWQEMQIREAGLMYHTATLTHGHIFAERKLYVYTKGLRQCVMASTICRCRHRLSSGSGRTGLFSSSHYRSRWRRCLRSCTKGHQIQCSGNHVQSVQAISLPRHQGPTFVQRFFMVYSNKFLQSCTCVYSFKPAAMSVILATDTSTCPIRVSICLPPLLPHTVNVALLVADSNELLKALVWALARSSRGPREGTQEWTIPARTTELL
jgi:hypothetical protein